MTTHALKASEFNDVLNSHPLILIDFWAKWCGPCKGFAKVMKTVSMDYPDVYFASVDVEEERELAEEFAVRSVPFIMLLRDRTVVYAESGALPEASVRELLDQAKNLTAEQLQDKQ